MYCFVRNLKRGLELLYLGGLVPPLAGMIIVAGDAAARVGWRRPEHPNNDGFEF